MKILILSDSHGNWDPMLRAAERERAMHLSELVAKLEEQIKGM